MTRLVIGIKTKSEYAHVSVGQIGGGVIPFADLLLATEYMMALTAAASPAGFEKALELMNEGATTWKTVKKGRP